MRVLNDTADFYRFFEATPHAEFFYSCVQKTVEEELPQELLAPNGGALSTRAREEEFSSLTEQEAADAEAAYREAFRPA